MKMKKKSKIVVELSTDELRHMQNFLYDYSRMLNDKAGGGSSPEYLRHLTAAMNGLRDR